MFPLFMEVAGGKSSRVRAGACALATIAAAFLALAAPALAAPARPYDFDGNGRQELAAGLPEWSTPGASYAGGVLVVRTGPHGLKRSSLLLTRATPGVPGDPQGSEGFGSSVASGDFNGDGYADLAIGDGEYFRPMTFVYGAKHGLDPHTAVSWGHGDYVLYRRLATGDFDHDGYDDLAVAEIQNPVIPFIEIIRGGPNGLRSTSSARFEAKVEELQAADLDRDGRLELAFASRREVGVCEFVVGVQSACQTTRAHGAPWSLATGDVTGDSAGEIVVGTPTYGNGGSVAVYSVKDGRPGLAFRITQATRHVPGRAESDDLFGSAVEVGRVGSAHKDTLVVGASREDQKGRVTIVHGATHGLARHGNFAFGVDSHRTPGSSRHVHSFGTALTLLDHNDDGRLELDVGAPSDLYGTDEGHVVSLLGAKGGLRRRGSVLVGMDKLGYGAGGSDLGSVLGRR